MNTACRVTQDLNEYHSHIGSLAISEGAIAVEQLQGVKEIAEKLRSGLSIGSVGFDDLFYRAGEIMSRKYFRVGGSRALKVDEKSDQVLIDASHELAFELLQLEDGPFMDFEELEFKAEQHEAELMSECAKELINLARGE